MSKFTVLSHLQASEIAKAILDRRPLARVSLDLGLSASTAKLDYDRQTVIFPDEAMLSFDEISKIASTEHVCFVVEKGKTTATKVQLFSPETNLSFVFNSTETKLSPLAKSLREWLALRENSR